MSTSTPPRAVEWPPCPFQEFMQHMVDSDGPEWVWTFVEVCSRFGVYYSGPDGIMLARPVNSAIPQDDLNAFNDLDPGTEIGTSDLTKHPDTWHILYGSGSPALFYSLCPYELENVSFHRNKGNGKLKTYNFKNFKRRIHGK
jgi:hypothetical protein